MPRINLLPWREAQRVEKQRQITVIAIGAAIFSCLAVVFVHIQFASMIESQNTRNTLLQNTIAKVEKEISEINTLKADKKALLARMEVIQTLQRSRPEIVHLFEEIALTTPDGVYLEKTIRKGELIKLFGVANSNDSVSKFMRRLDASQWLANPKLDFIENAAKGSKGSKFSLQVMQETPKLTEDDTADNSDQSKKEARR